MRITLISAGLLTVGCFGGFEAPEGTRDDGGAPDARDGSAGDGASSDGGDAGTGEELPSDALHAFRSGSRLQARYLRTQGAPDVFQDAYDSLLDQPCRFGPAADGKLRCLPTLTVMRGSGTDLHPQAQPVGYLDAGCTDPVYDAGSECPGRRRFIQEPSLCEDSVTVREVVKVSDDTPLYVRSGTDTCEASADLTVKGLYKRGNELPPSEMVEAKQAVLPIEGPLTRILYVGDDGSWIPGDLWIRDLETTCRARFWDEARACMLNTKTYGRWGEHFSDAACKMPALLAFTYVAPECPVPPYIVDDGRRTLGRVKQAFEKDEQGACIPIMGAEQLIALSTEAPPKLPETHGKLVGEGRLKARLVHGASGMPLTVATDDEVETSYWDATLNVQCEPIENAAGELRCVPGTLDTIREYSPPVDGSQRFADAGCVEHVDYCDSGICEKTVNYVKAADPTCGRLDLDVMWMWRERHEGTTYGFDEAGACVEMPDDRMLWRRAPLLWKDLPLIERLH